MCVNFTKKEITYQRKIGRVDSRDSGTFSKNFGKINEDYFLGNLAKLKRTLESKRRRVGGYIFFEGAWS